MHYGSRIESGMTKAGMTHDVLLWIPAQGRNDKEAQGRDASMLIVN
jgi:hypothetical protein